MSTMVRVPRSSSIVAQRKEHGSQRSEADDREEHDQYEDADDHGDHDRVLLTRP